MLCFNLDRFSITAVVASNIGIAIWNLLNNLSEEPITPFAYIIISSLHTTDLFLYPLKISENFTEFWCFQGVEKGYIGNKWVKNPDEQQLVPLKFKNCNTSFTFWDETDHT